MHSVNPQSMRRRYKNIAGLTCYIQLNGKQTKRPPHLLHCRKGRSTLKPLSLQLPLIPALNCFCLKVMSHAFLSSAGRIQWFSAAPSNICSRLKFVVSTAGHKKGYENMNYSTLPDYGLLTGLSIVSVHHGPERIHSELLNILLAFPCRMYPMDYEGTGFSMSDMVCMRFTHSKDR